MKARITAKLETSDHDGYCSGEDCYYESEMKIFIIDNIPKNMEIKFNEKDFPDWINYLDYESKGSSFSQSGYCGLDDESIKNGLDRHEYKYTIILVEIAENF